MGSGRYTELDIERLVLGIAPLTLPREAWGPLPLEWVSEPHDVWAWVAWPHQPGERLPGRAVGWNDRVVAVDVSNGRGRWQIVWWRTAITRRAASR